MLCSLCSPTICLALLTLGDQSNGGSACTCVVTEYRHHDRADFAIEVVQFTDAELTEQLQRLVRAYRYNHFHAAKMESEEDKIESKENRKHWADQAKLAWDTLEAMFADRVTRALLQNNSTSSVVEILMDLRLVPDIDGNAVVESVKDCSDLLMRLTSNRGGAQGGAAAWPYIKKIRYVCLPSCFESRQESNTTTACSSMRTSSARASS